MSTAPRDGTWLLLWFVDNEFSVGYWDAYYAEGGRGCTHGVAWVEPVSGELLRDHYGEPRGWQRPDPPVKENR